MFISKNEFIIFNIIINTVMNDIIKEIKDLQFGVLSAEDILDLSVCEVNNSKLSSQQGTVYDERMGSINMKKLYYMWFRRKEMSWPFWSYYFKRVYYTSTIL